jgi:hypothetical protein
MGEAVQPPFDLRKAVAVDWVTVSEKWETLKLSDGSKLKGRLTVVGFRRSEERQANGEPYYSWASRNDYGLLECPANLKGDPSQTIPSPEQMGDPSNHEEAVDFESTAMQENWNVYNLADSTVVRIRLIPQRITRTKFKDQFGLEPFYWINSQTVQRISVAKNLIVKPQPKPQKPILDKPYG